MAVLTTPLLNKGTAFAVEERIALGPTGLLPAAISTLDAQVKCAYVQYEGLGDALNKNLYLTALHDRNEILCKTRCGSRSTAGSRQPDMRKGRVK